VRSVVFFSFFGGEVSYYIKFEGSQPKVLVGHDKNWEAISADPYNCQWRQGLTRLERRKLGDQVSHKNRSKLL